jgi:phage/plasmid primase-like uncharacterized protein
MSTLDFSTSVASTQAHSRGGDRLAVSDVLSRVRHRPPPPAARYRIQCPAHDGRDFNCSLWPDQRDGRARFHCFSRGCAERDIAAAISGHAITCKPPVYITAAVKELTAAQRIEAALRIWRESRAAAGTLVETYLRTRGITIAIPPSIRFHARLRHPIGSHWPAMVGAIQNVTGQVVAIHRTWLRYDGRGKADLDPQKAMFGPCAGGAVRFAPAAATLVIAEGIETALSIVQSCPELAVWAALSTSGMEGLRVPAGVRAVILAADHDASAAGTIAACKAAARLRRIGIKVKIAMPPDAGVDFNDLLLVED